LATSRRRRTRALAGVSVPGRRREADGNMLGQQAWQVHGRCGGVSVAPDDQGDVQPPRADVVHDRRVAFLLALVEEAEAAVVAS